MPNNALYSLEPITDNPQYEGFGSAETDSTHPLLPRSFVSVDMNKAEGHCWEVMSVAQTWKPLPVVGRVRVFNDYPCVNLTVPAFSRRAVDALRDFLEPNGELLPLVSPLGEYYAYNVTTVVDILDREASEIVWLDKNRLSAFDIEKYVCIDPLMNGLSIFRIVEQYGFTYVSQAFVDRVYEKGLQGFHFVKLWPLPDGENWTDLDRRKSREERKVRTRKGSKPVTGNTVVIVLPTAKSTPGKVEREQLAKVMDELNRQLYDPMARSDDSYFGSLEGHDHYNKEYHLFVSCPDADALVDRLRPWLKTVHWPRPISVVKRYGEYVEADCREETVEL